MIDFLNATVWQYSDMGTAGNLFFSILLILTVTLPIWANLRDTRLYKACKWHFRRWVHKYALKTKKRLFWLILRINQRILASYNQI